MRDKIIRINWNKALPLEDAIASDLSNTQGLYYISRIFGNKETSLYLGIATQHNTIRNRLKNHSEHWLNLYRGKIYVRLGHIIYPRNHDASMIDHAESAILYEQKEVFFENTSKTKTFTVQRDGETLGSVTANYQKESTTVRTGDVTVLSNVPLKAGLQTITLVTYDQQLSFFYH